MSEPVSFASRRVSGATNWFINGLCPPALTDVERVHETVPEHLGLIGVVGAEQVVGPATHVGHFRHGLGRTSRW